MKPEDMEALVTELVSELLLIPELHFDGHKIASALEAGDFEVVKGMVFRCSGPCDPIIRHTGEVNAWLFRAQRRINSSLAQGQSAGGSR